MNIDISGNLRGPSVIFLAAWPDTSDVFRTNLMAHLAKDYRIVGITLPGYADATPFMRTYREGFRQVRRAKAESDARRRTTTGGTGSQHCGRAGNSGVAMRSAKAVLRGALSCARLVPIVSAHLPAGLDSAGDDDDNFAAGLHDMEEEDADPDLVRYQIDNEDEPLVTPLFGYGFMDLVVLLEIAVDAAMESYNECPSAFLATSLVDSRESVRGIPVHQLPPFYPRPVFVAHGWGVQLAFELLLSRPDYFSRVVALDSGAAVFGAPAAARRPSRYSDSEVPSSPLSPITPVAAGASGAVRRRQATRGVVGPSRGVVARTAAAADPAARDDGGELVGATPQRTAADHRRHLASRYAVRPRRTNAANTTNVRNIWQRLGIFVYQLLIIACTFTVPRFAAGWILRFMLWMAKRPRYTVDPRLQITPENEAFNQKLYQQRHFEAHYQQHGAARGGSFPNAAMRISGTAYPGGSPAHEQHDDGTASNRTCNDGLLSTSTDHTVSLSNFRVPHNRVWRVVLVPFMRSEDATDGAGKSSAAARASKPIDIGFTAGLEAPWYSGAPDITYETATGVSPYYSYRNNVNALYDSAHTSAGSCAAGGAAPGKLWHPGSAGGTITSSSSGGSLWKRRAIYYRPFLIPPPVRTYSVDELYDSAAEPPDSYADGPAHTHAASRLRRWGRRAEAPVEVQSTMGWIYLQYWWGVVLSFLFSPSPEKRARHDATRGGSALHTSDGNTHPAGGNGSSTTVAQVAGAHSPLVSQRFFFPVTIPVLYMYGASKPFMLHSSQWCDYVRDQKRAEDGISDVVEVQGGGHWFFAEHKYQKKVAERVAEFIIATTRQSAVL